jgi:hypothetical protein
MLPEDTCVDTFCFASGYAGHGSLPAEALAKAGGERGVLLMAKFVFRQPESAHLDVKLVRFLFYLVINSRALSATRPADGGS